MIGKLAGGLFAAALLAAAASASEPSNKSGAKADPNKIVCRTVSEIGSRLKKTRACHTLAEWAELRRQTKSTVEHIQDSRNANLSN
jgi:hypothetical protein